MRAYISDSLISESLLLLQSMKQNNCFSVDEIESINTYYGINKEAAIKLALQCKWIELINESTYGITTLGDGFLLEFNDMQITKHLYRDILFSYISVCVPIWARKIPYGRLEAFRIMSEEEQMCFKKAGLMNDPVTREEVDWWGSLAKIERIKIENTNENDGRDAEELTIAYEKNRTNTNPLWESVNSNLAGFDILSQVSDIDTSPILIEVKSSTKDIQNAAFYITHNEWNIASVAINRNKYYFYLWLLNDTNKLAIIPCAEMEKHIPQESGCGVWKEVAIPYTAFESSFVSIDALIYDG